MSAVADQKVRTWAATTSHKVPDSIVSSQFTSQKLFIPSYEKEKRPCMEQLLTNEYQRIWWQEKETWDRIHTKKITTKKLMQRMVIRKKPAVAPTVTAKPGKKVRKLKDKVNVNAKEKAEESKQSPQKEKSSPKQEKVKTEKVEETKVKEST